MSFKVPMRVLLVFMISVGIMPIATAQTDPTFLHVSRHPSQELYQEVNTLARETQYTQVTRGDDKPKSLELLNVSYDPTRELWRNLSAKFISKYLKETNTKLEIKQSHGGSSTQARAVIDGLEADVVTLALWYLCAISFRSSRFLMPLLTCRWRCLPPSPASFTPACMCKKAGSGSSSYP